jgi:hypothetical protein
MGGDEGIGRERQGEAGGGREGESGREGNRGDERDGTACKTWPPKRLFRGALPRYFEHPLP